MNMAYSDGRAAAADPAHPPLNFVEHLQALAASRPSDLAMVAVGDQDDGQADVRLTYAALDQRVRALAASLQRQFTAGERALILLENGEHYVVAFLACLYAGLIAVPAFPPETTRQQHLARLRGMVGDSQACCVLTTRAVAEQFSAALQELSGVTVLTMEAIDERQATQWRTHQPSGSDIAFLQYTSGSTSTPKGVMVSHDSLMANERAIEEGLGVRRDDVFVTWLPLFHDMGLIGGMLQPLHRGIPLVLMPTRLVLERPARWLQAITRYRGTISGGPDFAYRLCVDRVRDTQVEKLDLSSWRVAFSGAEPVRHDTLQAFEERFAPVGFDAKALYPCYGLAEATLFVTGGVRGTGLVAHRFDTLELAQGQARPSAHGAMLVACGGSPRHHEVRIVDPATEQALPAGRIGEIWAGGPSIASGYWQRPDASDETFLIRGGQRWLRTGDLGFVHEGQLYVAGRLKDMIILRGHNVYPQDLERAVESGVEAVRKGRVAAFSVMVDGEEGIGLAAEVSRGLQKLVTPQALADLLSEVVGEQAGQAPMAIALLNPGGLPKTSSGKLQRAACRKAWTERSLDAYALLERGRWLMHPDIDANAPSLTGQSVDPAFNGPVVNVPSDAPDGPWDERAARRAPSGIPSGARPRALTETEQTLAALWREVLALPASQALTPDAHFFALGGNSLLAVQLAERLRSQWRVAFPTSRLFEYTRLKAQAEALLAAHAAVGEGQATIAALPTTLRQGPLPLTAAQQQQYFLWRMDPGSSAYHVPCILRIEGVVDAERLQSAFAALVARHEALRTVFRVDANAQVMQWVQPVQAMPFMPAAAQDPGTATLQVVNLMGAVDAPVAAAARSESQTAPGSDQDPERIEQAALSLAGKLIATPFDLATGPLIRATLFRLGEHRHLLAMVVHHIVADGTSLQGMIDELAALHGGEVLPPVPLQYGDYAAWHHERQDPNRDSASLAYWQDRLRAGDGGSSPLVLPADRPRAPDQQHRTATLTVDLPTDLMAALRLQAGAQDGTLFMALLASFKILLHRYTGQRDIRVGAPFANRPTTQLQPVIGCFVNTLLLRTAVEPQMALGAVLEQVRQTVLGAQAHQDLPLDRLMRSLPADRGAAPQTPFQIVFNHLNVNHDAARRLTGWALEDLSVPPGHAQFELALETRENASGAITATLIWADGLFERDTMARLAGHFQQVLQVMAASPDTAVRDLALLDDGETRRLRHWGGPDPGTATPFAPVHRLFERHAQAHPEAPALLAGDVTLSYEDLDRQANQLAHRLIAQGVGPEVRVGVALDRSPALIVSLLAVLKAGGAYVPLDPALPADRLRTMIQDSGMRLLLTRANEARRLPQVPSVPMLDLDLDDLARHQAPVTAPDVSTHPDSLAYIIYTSGSTGTPKGVAVAHGPFAMHCVVTAVLYEMDARSRELHFLSFSFDGAHERLFTALCCGASLVLRDAGLWSPGETLAAIAQQGVTNAGFPAVYLHEMAHAAAAQRAAPPVHLYSFGGEAMPREGLVMAQAHLAAQVLINGYGPTEAVVTPTLWKARTSTPLPDAPYAPIGRPVGDRKALVLDASLNLLPQGQVGELYLGGSGLARGYLQRPGLTAERFIPDPFDASGGRLYRTGDLVRWNREGQLEYLGRADQQIKIRGFRIEPGEIEAALLAQPHVRQAAVLARAGAAGLRLVGYVAPQAGQTLDAALLRDQLAQRLPDYMVPATIVVLDALPVTVNGKVDRAALPEPTVAAGAAGRDASSPMAQPLGDLEQRVAVILAEVLGVPEVGLTDNFFDLGGHSLLLIRLHRLLEDRLQARLRMVDLFKHPNVEALARHLRLAQRPLAGGDGHGHGAGDVATDTHPIHGASDAAPSRRDALLRRKRSAERTS
ncbi:amino acid adenylation domain-containing protein [Roseateles sp. YR242]|nr:amino acid adenylation domain-containing protein [Roseateles sp. YR242]